MNNKLRENSRDLLTCFFTECESTFRFLELKHDYGYLSGLIDYRQGRQIITPYHGQSIENSFRAVTRYEMENNAIEILYGDKEFMIEAYIYINQIHRLSLSDILLAAKKDDNSTKNNRQITKQNQIERKIHNISASIKKNKRHFLEPNERMIERALTMRGKRMEQSIREQEPIPLI